MKLSVRSPAEVVLDVARWPPRLAAILADVTRNEVAYLAGEAALFSQHLEAVEAAIVRRREEHEKADSRALRLALEGGSPKHSKGSERRPPGAPHELLTYTGPHPGEYHHATGS